jgi:acyl-coenzyme A thioesterase PaaI-like protein
VPLAAPLANEGCFGCGPANPIGFHLAFEEHPEGGVLARFVFRPEHQGWDGVVHGGLVSVLLDEAMAWAASSSTVMYYTARMEVRYRRPVPVHAPLVVRGWVLSKRGSRLETRAEVQSNGGEKLAEATALFLRAPSST